MCNIIKTTSLKYNCTSCVNFISYADEYEDDLEPYDLGRCIKGIAEMAESELICDLWEEKKPNNKKNKMKDELISLETAILAKKKEFDIYTDYVYIQISEHLSYNHYKNEEYIVEEGEPFVANRNYLPTQAPFSNLCSAPSQSLLQKWLRETHNIHITIWYNELAEKYRIDTPENIDEQEYNTYEDALEKALQEALKLI